MERKKPFKGVTTNGSWIEFKMGQFSPIFFTNAFYFFYPGRI
jgi:hypothetical protein